jgi:hypothetical protein
VGCWLLTALLLLGGGSARAEPLQDGPYVVRTADGKWLARWIEGEAASARVREQPVKVGDAVTIAAVSALPPFDVKIRGEAQLAPDEINVRSRTPLFVMADTHGEFEIAVQLLQRQHVIDERLNWAFGKGHLAILGDVFDRGPNQTELLWLFYELEAQAARAGGGVHLAIGNHEAMLLNGDERYLNPKYKQVAALLGSSSYAQLWSKQTLLGEWLRSKAAVFRLGDYLCLHGGISRELVDRGLTLQQTNRALREFLDGGSSEQIEFLTGRSGPLWYRGYFPAPAGGGDFQPALSADIDLIRERFKVGTILVGHTMVPSITPLYDGRVIAVQVYPRRDRDSNAPVMEGLSIQRGKLFRARVDGSTEALATQPH